MQNEMGVAVVGGAAEHGHPSFDVGVGVWDGGFEEIFEVTVGTVLEHHGDVLVFGAEDVVHGNHGGVGEFLEVFDFADCVDVEAEFGLGGIDFKFLDGDEEGRVVAEVTFIHRGVRAGAKEFAWSWLLDSGLDVGRKGV